MRGRGAFLVGVLVWFALQPANLWAAQIGVASTTKNDVSGIVGSNRRQLSAGSEVYSDELIRTGTGSLGDFVFVDETKLTVGPSSEVRLNRLVYNPSGSNSSVVMNLTRRVSLHQRRPAQAGLFDPYPVRHDRHPWHGAANQCHR